MRIGIVGGGLAGVTLGAALARNGIEFDLFERASAFEPVGAGIALMPPALRVADRLGLGAALRETSVSLSTMRWLAAKGRLLLEMSYPGLWQGHELRSIHRHRLHEVLLSMVPRERTRLGAPVASIAEAGDEVEIRTEDGASQRYDLVVGADGVHSRIRSLVCGETPPRYLGQNYWRATLQRGDLVDSYVLVVAADRSLGMVPLGGGRTHFFAQQVSDEPLTDPLEGRLERLRARFANFTGAAEAALQSLEGDRDVHFGHGYELTSPPRPSASGRVVLIGDADHATSPNLGVGGAMAMEDAIVLAEELARAPVAHAVAAFRQRRRPRIEWVQQRTLAWVQRMRSGERVADPAAIYREDYAPLLAEP